MSCHTGAGCDYRTETLLVGMSLVLLGIWYAQRSQIHDRIFRIEVRNEALRQETKEQQIRIETMKNGIEEQKRAMEEQKRALTQPSPRQPSAPNDLQTR